MKKSKVTDLSKVIESKEQDKVYTLTKYVEIREKNITKEHEKLQGSLFTSVSS